MTFNHEKGTFYRLQKNFTHNIDRPIGCYLQGRHLLPCPDPLPLLLDRRSIGLSGAREKEGHFHYRRLPQTWDDVTDLYFIFSKLL